MSSIKLQEIFKEAEARGYMPTLMLDGTEGLIVAGGGRNVFDSDGSGHLASGNIVWDALGNLSIYGHFQSNGSGNRIEIDPTARTIKMIDKFGDIVVEMGFYEYGNDTGADIVFKSYDSNRKINSSARILGGSIQLYKGDVDQANNYASISHDGKTRFSLSPDQMPNRNEAYHSQMYLDGENLKIKR